MTDVTETFLIRKGIFSKDVAQTSLSFAHDEQDGSLEVSSPASAVVEVDIVIWEAKIYRDNLPNYHHTCFPPF